MNMDMVNCEECNTTFSRPAKRANEAIKYGWKQYCSRICQNKHKNLQQAFVCRNTNAGITLCTCIGNHLLTSYDNTQLIDINTQYKVTGKIPQQVSSAATTCRSSI